MVRKFNTSDITERKDLIEIINKYLDNLEIPLIGLDYDDKGSMALIQPYYSKSFVPDNIITKFKPNTKLGVLEQNREEILNLIKSGEEFDKIASQYNVSAPTLLIWRKKHGLA